MKLEELRRRFHERIAKDLYRINKNKTKGDYPNNADGDSRISVKIANAIISELGVTPEFGTMSGQRAGSIFEQLVRDFLKESFELLQHLRPGVFTYSIQTPISFFEQYKDLEDIEKAVKNNKKLATTLGQDYIVKPDITISREPVTDDEINRLGHLLKNTPDVSTYTPLRKQNHSTSRNMLHASISCKSTLRSDRAQNVRTEALNLIRNRKGHLPHIVAVTAEPTLTRIASLALGTGDLDCVYHFALPELKKALLKINDESQIDMFNILVDGRRLRDISDLTFDLAI